MVLTILQDPHPTLRSRCKNVAKEDIPKLRDLVSNMIDTLNESGGVGLAAPQVGEPLRLIVVALENEPPLVVFNPIITKKIGKMSCSEGCLSIPGKTFRTTRAREVTIEGWSEKLEPVSRTLSGLWSQAIQHEVEHLDGKTLNSR